MHTPDRVGVITEYRRGARILTIIKWDDGHREAELHDCTPRRLSYTCDPKEIDHLAERFLGALALEVEGEGKKKGGTPDEAEDTDHHRTR